MIEDNFIAGRPAWETVGVEFTDDVTAYENMKLSLLNASHTLLSYPAFLSGYRKVDEAMHDERFAHFLRTFMDKDITPYVPVPGNTDLELYKQTLIERFANRSVSDQLARLCFDGVSKYPVYVMPNLIKMIRDKADFTRVAFSMAAYRHYLKYRTECLMCGDIRHAHKVPQPPDDRTYSAEVTAIGAISRIIAVRAQSIPQRAPLYSNPRSRECQAFFRFFS